MGDVLQQIQPVSVGTITTIQNISFSATDWLEVNNESPFSISVAPQGVQNSTFQLAPFEKNAWPILQILGSSTLKVSTVSLVLTPGHFYSDPATEANAPMNLCIVSKLSNAEAKTNVYPSYMQRMNTTVSTIANTLNNTGNPPATPFIFAEPVGDTNANGAVNINNQGQATFGDPTYNGSLAILGTASPVARLFVTNLIAALQMVDTNSNVDVDLESGSNILNGGSSGTAQIWTPFRGLWKITIIQLNNFKTGASNQLLNFPGIYSNRAFILATDCEGTELFKGGVAQSVRQWTSFGAAGSGGGTTATTIWQGFNLLWLATGFDQIQFNSGWASTRNGVILIIGS